MWTMQWQPPCPAGTTPTAPLPAPPPLASSECRPQSSCLCARPSRTCTSLRTADGKVSPIAAFTLCWTVKLAAACADLVQASDHHSNRCTLTISQRPVKSCVLPVSIPCEHAMQVNSAQKLTAASETAHVHPSAMHVQLDGTGSVQIAQEAVCKAKLYVLKTFVCTPALPPCAITIQSFCNAYSLIVKHSSSHLYCLSHRQRQLAYDLLHTDSCVQCRLCVCRQPAVLVCQHQLQCSASHAITPQAGP